MLDLKTILVVALATASLQAAAWIFVWRAWRHLYELKFIAAGFGAIAVGLLLMILRGAEPEALAIVLHNTVIKLGLVLLAEGDSRAALAKLRAVHRSWRELEAPHQAARVRLLIGVACRELGDGASAELEFEAARSALEQLGARPDLERLARVAGTPRPGGLSRRESEVLMLLAAGKTNRAIASFSWLARLRRSS